MTNSLAVLASGLLLTAVAVAVLWYASPWVVGQRAPGGLLGMIVAIGVGASLTGSRRKRTTEGDGDPKV